MRQARQAVSTPVVALAMAAFSASALAQSKLGPPIVAPGVRLGVQVTPAFPQGDLGDVADTGVGGRLRLGSEYMFGRLGVSPGASAQVLRFEPDTVPGAPEGSFLYVGALPGVQVAGHLGMAAPFFGFGVGVDYFRVTGDLGDVIEDGGFDRSTTGAGFEFVMGCDVWLAPSFGMHVGVQVHPGATELNDGSMTFTAFDLGMTAAF